MHEFDVRLYRNKKTRPPLAQRRPKLPDKNRVHPRFSSRPWIKNIFIGPCSRPAMRIRRISSVVAFFLAVSSCHSFAPKWKENRLGIAKAVKEDNEWLVPDTGLSGQIWEERPKAVLTTSSNATLPIAMMVLDPELFPSRSMAMRAIRYVLHGVGHIKSKNST